MDLDWRLCKVEHTYWNKRSLNKKITILKKSGLSDFLVKLGISPHFMQLRTTPAPSVLDPSSRRTTGKFIPGPTLYDGRYLYGFQIEFQNRKKKKNRTHPREVGRKKSKKILKYREHYRSMLTWRIGPSLRWQALGMSSARRVQRALPHISFCFELNLCEFFFFCKVMNYC